ncbi:hypothetical protein [Streptomyces sp. NPDC088725]|uniref:hypothetical protein n=1 Tax=Streptomyces sp. NPDC088725 TaxID=3365873 RepID=UPI00380D0CEF
MADLYRDPETAQRRCAVRYLWRLIRSQKSRIAAGSLFGTLGTVGLTVPPCLLSHALDDGLGAGRGAQLAGSAGASGS